MDYWDDIWNQIVTNPEIKKEYRKVYLLNIFQKICSKMNNDSLYKENNLALFRQSFDRIHTVRMIVEKGANLSITEEDAKVMSIWFDAYRKKNNNRTRFSEDEKNELFEKQNGLCNICNEPLGNNMKKIHVDHIIPWVLVGDELKNNYQLLCETCNQCKSSRIDYVFRSLIKII